jgi:hypothetical protein
MAEDRQPLPSLTMENIHGFNAEQVARYAGVGREAALELLRQNAIATADMLRNLSNAQLDIGTVFLGHSMTVASLAQNALVAHAEEHLARIQSVAAGRDDAP